MAIQPTSAARLLEDRQQNVDSHQLISLLMAGGLERISQAKASISEGDRDETDALLKKIIAIIGGLRSSLDFSQGGEIATNLGSLYEYMMNRIESSGNSEEGVDAIDEVAKLLSDVKDGWDQIGADRPINRS